jgi:hypothetical protein
MHCNLFSFLCIIEIDVNKQSPAFFEIANFAMEKKIDGKTCETYVVYEKNIPNSHIFPKKANKNLDRNVKIIQAKYIFYEF